METQRLEEARARKSNEIDRRNLQQRTNRINQVEGDRKIVAKLFAKDFLKSFKRDTLKIMADLGTLRKPIDFSIGSHYVPQLYGQVKADMQTYVNSQNNMDGLMNDQMTSLAKSHKAAIIKEQNRRAEKKKLEMQKKLQNEDERRLRKEKRAALREEYRLSNLQESLMTQMIQNADLQEYTPKMRIYDVRDPVASNDGIILIGGFVGEVILTLTCLLDYILASPQNQNFVFNPDLLEQFINDLLGADDCLFPDNICQMFVREGIEEFSEDSRVTPEQACYLL